jgi:hypothetical protein
MCEQDDESRERLMALHELRVTVHQRNTAELDPASPLSGSRMMASVAVAAAMLPLNTCEHLDPSRLDQNTPADLWLEHRDYVCADCAGDWQSTESVVAGVCSLCRESASSPWALTWSTGLIDVHATACDFCLTWIQTGTTTATPQARTA